MSTLGNFLGYQAVWFIAVIAAGRGLAWPALLAMAGFAAWQLSRSRSRGADLRLSGLALLLGALLDGTLSFAGLLRYAAPSPALPPGGAPLWILALWAAFALTLNHSLIWLQQRRIAAALLGAAGGPLAYLGAARLARAVTFRTPTVAAIAVLAAGWAMALCVLATSAANWSANDTGREVPT